MATSTSHVPWIRNADLHQLILRGVVLPPGVVHCVCQKRTAVAVNYVTPGLLHSSASAVNKTCSVYISLVSTREPDRPATCVYSRGTTSLVFSIKIDCQYAA
jgi:hypothetical protein